MARWRSEARTQGNQDFCVTDLVLPPDLQECPIRTVLIQISQKDAQSDKCLCYTSIFNIQCQVNLIS